MKQTDTARLSCHINSISPPTKRKEDLNDSLIVRIVCSYNIKLWTLMLNKLSSRHAKLVFLKLQENFIGSIITQAKDILAHLLMAIPVILSQCWYTTTRSYKEYKDLTSHTWQHKSSLLIVIIQSNTAASNFDYCRIGNISMISWQSFKLSPWKINGAERF